MEAAESEGSHEPTLEEVREHSRRKTLGIRAASAAVMVAIVVAAYWVLGDRGLDIVVGVVAAICFFELLFLIVKATGNIAFRLAGILAGVAYIGLAAVILIDFDIQSFYISVAVVILADTFAYVFGTLIGGPRIMPKVSPNKTWAGLFGGMFGGFLALTPLVYLSSRIMGVLDTQALLVAAVAGPVLAIIALAGDLFESWLKRKAAVKDSSRLIPGHGGFLDRFDGLIPVAIVVGVLTTLAI
jgi:phosphatidate cytidylyltransferase|tara:strand:- start:3362 stop:4087 length:726 start_codon:yes stop_codon:yes gene_type:complete